MNSNEQQKFDKDEGRCRMGRRRFYKIPLVLLMLLVKSGVVFFLWNELIPDLFHGPLLTYLQALELTVLVKVLVGFGGFRGGHHHPGHFGRGRWMHLSREERMKMREEMSNRLREEK